MHNDRINSVQKLMNKYANVNKYLGEVNHNEQQLIKNIENFEQENKLKKQNEQNKPQEIK